MSAQNDPITVLKIETLDLCQARCIEAVLFLSGGPVIYPIWAQRLGSLLAKRVVPAATVEAAEGDRAAFYEGLAGGFGVTHTGMIKTVSIDAKERAMLAETRFAMAGTAEKFLEIFDSNKAPDVLAEIQAEVCRRAVSSPVARKAYFHGFVTGLEIEKTMEEVAKRFAKEIQNSKSLFARHLFMWAHWPHLETMESPEDVFLFCKKKFSQIGRAGIVGDKPAFRRFWNRLRHPTKHAD